MATPEDPKSMQGHNSQQTDKQIIRKALRANRRTRRDNTSPAARAAGAHGVCTHLANYPAIWGARCIATYEPLPTEEDVSPLSQLLEPGVQYLVPITHDDLDLSWRDLKTGEDLGKDAIALADVVIAPALAVGPQGQRLGQGGGSYDRALPRRSPGTPVVAVVFPDETGIRFPTEPHDELVDAAATREGIVTF